jgi:pyridoxal phosphate enzyme (YggS family)
MLDISEFIKTEIPSQVKLLIVTKNRNLSEIRPFLEKGYCYFGESLVQEASQKWLMLKQEFPNAKLHMIGHLQSNKILKALQLFDVIETVDSFEKAQLIADAMQTMHKKIVFYTQVNIGEEKQKHGVGLKNVKQLVDFSRGLGLEIEGLMCIPPQNKDPLPYFNQMRLCADECGVKTLSMGMSNDFKEAIKAGANQIRLGRVLFE